MNHGVKIIGNGMVVPTQKILSNLDYSLQGFGKITDKYGVNRRFWAKDETNSSMAAQSLNIALEKAKIKYEELDLLINASATYDYPLPATSCLVPQHLEKTHLTIPCLDINSSCLSFVAALEVACSLLKTDNYKKIAIVSSEISSKNLNPDNPETYSLFGDGSACVILENDKENQSSFGDFVFKTYPEGALYTCVPAGGNIANRITDNPVKEKYYFHMDGKKVLSFTIRKLKEFLDEFKNKTGKEMKDFQLIIPHQASRISLDFCLKNYDLKDGQLYDILKDYGNCVAASIPMALSLAIDEKRINRGDEVLILGTAAGITIGGVRMIY